MCYTPLLSTDPIGPAGGALRAVTWGSDRFVVGGWAFDRHGDGRNKTTRLRLNRSQARPGAPTAGRAPDVPRTTDRRHATDRASLAERGNEVKRHREDIGRARRILATRRAGSTCPRRALRPRGVARCLPRGWRGSREGRCEGGHLSHGPTDGRDVARARPTSLGSALCPARGAPRLLARLRKGPDLRRNV